MLLHKGFFFFLVCVCVCVCHMLLMFHTEFFDTLLCRGSLFRLIHRPAAGEVLDKRRRLRMALDVVCAESWSIHLNLH